MLTKLLISVLIIESVVVTAIKLQDLGDYYDDPPVTNPPIPPLAAPTSTTSPPPSTTTAKTTEICMDLKPEFISTRRGGYKQLDCSAKICDTDGDIDVGSGRRFGRPIFDWNSQFGHIFATNGTCDSERLNCWHSIDIDLEYLSHQMLDNGLNEMQISCSVSDYLSGTDEDDTQWTVGSDYSIVKRFKGRGIDESCDNDGQCGDNMFCLNSGRNGGTLCQCSVDFLSGVPFVQVLDSKYEEWICMPPLMLNDTCLYDKQCQALDPNSVCGDKHIDMIDFGVGICQCAQDMVYVVESGCAEPQELEEVDSKPSIIWWIFTSNDKEESSEHRFWWLKTASYSVALLSILLPLSLIFIALGMLCYRRMARKKSAVQTVIRPKFPSAAAPKIMINDFMRKEKSEDKYDLVKNDHLISQ